MAYDDRLIVDYIKQTHDTDLLSEREKHLVGLAVTMTRGCQVCTRNRVEKAHGIGIFDDELNALVAVTAAVRWSIETETRIRRTSLSSRAAPRTSSRVAGGFIDVGQRPPIRGHTDSRVKRDTPRRGYAARFSVMTGRCFLPCRNSSLTCTAPLVDSIGAGGEAQGNVLGQRGRGSNLGSSHAGDRS